MKRIFLLILVTLAASLGKAQSEAEYYNLPATESQNYADQFISYWENDMFLHTDYYYTNGVAFDFITDHLRAPRIEKLLSTPLTQNNRSYGFSLRQNMYTPEKMYSSDLQLKGRPYAGYLTGEYKLISESSRKRFTSSITLGVMGDYSMAGRTQNLIHNTDHMSLALGWDYQVNNALIINIKYKYEQKILDNNIFDIQYCLIGQLGSLFTDASGNAKLRIGKRNSSFDHTSKVSKNDFESYLFITGGGRVSYYDATLQGSILSIKPNQYYLNNSDRYLFVSQVSGGLVLSYKFLRIQGSLTQISPEFKNGKSHAWGSLSLGVAF